MRALSLFVPRLLLLCLLPLLASVAVPALADAAKTPTPPDSLPGVYALPSVVVTADPLAPAPALGETRLGGPSLRERSEPDVAGLAPLLPALRLGLNSRGESQFMLRGASERHLLVSQDGIPLNLAWDERSDLSLQPAEAVGAVRVRRGVRSLLQGAGALAGSLELHSRAAPAAGGESALDLGVGEAGHLRAALLHGRRLGAWGLLASLARTRRDGWLRPAGYHSAYNEAQGRLRQNSDLARASAFVTLDRPLPREGRLALHLGGSRVEKGVPPETHSEDARFWRYPDSQRWLGGFGLDQPLDAGGAWRLGLVAALDAADTDILDYEDASYSGPAAAIGRELDEDRTLHLRLLLERRFAGGRLSLASELRNARHKELLPGETDWQRYAQRRIAETLELEFSPRPAWTLRAGTAWLRASTPASGDKPARDADQMSDWLLSLGRRLDGAQSLELSLSRRGRFPGLRELYSGALGKFVPNPDLAPEAQTLTELAYRREGERLRLDCSLFAARLAGAIERIVVNSETGAFQRVNLDALRSLGAEAELALRAGAGVDVSIHWLQLAARRRVDGDYEGQVEDRPNCIGGLRLGWSAPRGWRLGAEAGLLGPRWSADATDAADGLRRLPAQGRLALLAAWRRYLGRAGLEDLELRLRLDNALDSIVESQTGLVEPGRSLQVGLRLGLGV